MVEQLLVNATVKPPTEVIAGLADLVGAIMCSFDGTDFGAALGEFPQDGPRSLLSPQAPEKAQKEFGVLFGTLPHLGSKIDAVASYQEFCQSVDALVSDEACECSQCPGSHIWAILGLPDRRPRCRVRRIWGGLEDLIGQAVLPITQFPRTKVGRHLCRRLLARANILRGDANSPPPERKGGYYSTGNLHDGLCALLGSVPSTAGAGQNIIGTSSGATSTFPATLLKTADGIVSNSEAHMMRYRVVDGQFHDGHSYYKCLIERDNVPPRPPAVVSILPPGQEPQRLGLSHLGVHSNLMLSVRPAHNALVLRVTVTFDVARVMDVSFYDTRLAFMATSVAAPCYHNRDHDHSPGRLLSFTRTIP
ncbi:Carbamoyl-phosphate synthase small chain [Madurella mycetomatis]|uniref:Carbamoyl-phosphate synthase small chain n=1 Tax=Madurella mycetomatis TaxID=100816 RepID=A0A175W7B9_9PEZI|nr:Carbamoyl-phosphate synthase small chain [Madurella mycetomatis]